MKLKECKQLDKARKMLQNNEILELKNAIWFAKYLINEYVVNNDMQIMYSFTPNYEVGECYVDSLGIYRNAMVPNMHDELVSNSMKINGNMSLEKLLWYYFLSLGNDVIASRLSDNMINNIFIFDNPAGYTLKQYSIYKESLIANTISGEFLEKYRESWLNFSEASIIGGNIFLDIVHDNFDDCSILDGSKDYFTKKVNAYKMNQYGSFRKELVNGINSLIETHPDAFLGNDSDLILEFNSDGTRKNFFELMDMRERVKNNLENQLEFYDEINIKDKIEKCLRDKDILFGEFVYNSLVILDDEVINEILKNITSEDLDFIDRSVDRKIIEVQKILAFISSYDGVMEASEKEELFSDWKFEETDCSRLKFMIQQINNSNIKKAILK